MAMSRSTELQTPAGMSAGMTLLLAVTAGISVANLYLAQPMIGLIGPSVGLGPSAYGLVVTVTQIGYAAGLLLLVPLGDFVENRRLMVVTLSLSAVTLLLTSFAHTPDLFLLACLLIGITSVTTQMVVPVAAHLADPARRGRQVGTVVSGLLTGILLGRPFASIVASISGWRSVFIIATVAMLCMALVLWFRLPDRHPQVRKNYLAVLASMWPLLRRTAVLRRRMGYHMGLFFAFSVFWTAIPLELTRHFGLHQRGIAIFSLMGAAGALSSPAAGRMADAGKSVPGTIGSMIMVAAGIGLTWPASMATGWLGLAAFAVAAILLDGGVQAHLAFAQKAIFDLAPEHRSRVNAIFIAGAFIAAAIGSAAAPLVFTLDHWPLVALLGVIPPLLALAAFVRHERRGSRRAAA
ncbi:MAG: MFS transporter [Proteobacteria bacterium]|nr:MFS transporter [Pseudomonadota bacterium]